LQFRGLYATISNTFMEDIVARRTMTRERLERMQDLNYKELLQLVELIKSSTQFSEFRFRSGDIEIELRRGPHRSDSSPPPDATEIAETGRGTSGDASGQGKVVPGDAQKRITARVDATPPPAAAAVKDEPPSAGATVIKSPMVGVFYRAAEPGAKPFVEVGTTVDVDTTVCIIEVMKLMNSIPAGCRGTVRRILVSDGEAVEFGQSLLVIEPN
jgi:acetyl-CoA carboxylase biotin carboxyl carrier protein